MKRVITTSAAASLLCALGYASVAMSQDEIPEHSHPATVEHEHELGEGDDMMMVPMHGHQYQSHPASTHGHDELHGHSATLYGNLRYGVEMTDTDEPGDDGDATWDLGKDKFSRWGVKGSMPAGEGLKAGYRFERNLADMSARYHYVSLSGGAGTATFGQQDSPFRGATSWDGTQAYGGAGNGSSARTAGVGYASNLGGPFNFSALVGSGAMGANSSGKGADHFEVSGTLAMGLASASIGYFDSKDASQNATQDVSRFGGTVSGDVAAINWEIGYNAGTDTCGEGCDDEQFGFHLGYGVSESGNIYMNYTDSEFDDNEYMTKGKLSKQDANDWVFGYTHVVAKNVVVYAEYGMSETNDVEMTEGVVALKVGF